MGSYCTKLEQPTPESDPLEVLHELQNSLEHKIRFCDHRMDSLTRQGKAFTAAGDAERAREMARLTITHKENRTKYVRMHTTVTQMVVAITASHDSVDILKHYKLGNDTLHTVLSRVNLDEVDEVLIQLAERIEDAQELQEALSVPIGLSDCQGVEELRDLSTPLLSKQKVLA